MQVPSEVSQSHSGLGGVGFASRRIASLGHPCQQNTS